MISGSHNFVRVERFALYIHFFAWIFLTLAACGGSGNIPVASVLSSGRVTLSWDDIPGAASYELYISTSPGITVLNSYKINDVSPPITITDLEPGTTYYFMVAVFSDSGESRTSKEVTYRVTESEGELDLGDLLADTESAEQAQPVEEAPVPAAAELTKQAQPAVKAPVPIAAGQPKTARKTQPQAAAVPGNKSTQTVSKNAAVPAVIATAPRDQKKVPGTQDITVAWDDVPNASSYNIYWRDKKGVTKQNGTKIANVTNPYKMKNLIKGKSYYFIVTAVNASGESAPSEEFSFTVGK